MAATHVRKLQVGHSIIEAVFLFVHLLSLESIFAIHPLAILPMVRRDDEGVTNVQHGVNWRVERLRRVESKRWRVVGNDKSAKAFGRDWFGEEVLHLQVWGLCQLVKVE